MNRWHALVLLLAASAALLLRGPNLGLRAMHNDEGVNAVKLGSLLDHGQYRYDPHEYHGPTLHYAAWVVAKTAGVAHSRDLSETCLRAVALLFGLSLILLLPLVGDGLGHRGILWAALFTAVSPAFVFYSQYFIHEMLLVSFAALAIASGWRYWRTRHAGWAVFCGVSLGLMHATKETFVFNLAAIAGALLLNQLWNRFLDASKQPFRAALPRLSHVLIGGALWLLVAILFFSSFFTNAQGPLDSLRTYLPWLHRAGGESPHLQPWYFYFERLLFFKAANGPLWSELAIALLALIGAGSAFTRNRLEPTTNASFIRFLALYTILLTGVYTIIPYKTPWCFLSFWHGAVLLAGVGANVVMRYARNPYGRTALGLTLLVAGGQLAWQAWSATTKFAADRRNPFVYAHTSADVMRMLDKVRSICEASPQGQATRINVIAEDGDYWPLPWYLRSYPQVAWLDAVPADRNVPVSIVSAKLNAALDQDRTHLMIGYFEFRPGLFLEVYVELELWKAYLAKNPAPITEQD